MYKRILLLLFLIPNAVFAYSTLGQPAGFVNDYVGVFSSEQKAGLEAKLFDFEKSSSSEIAVAVIKSLEGDTIENYAVNLYSEWGIGKKGKDNGVLLLVAIEDRKMRIEVGYGLEGALTDLQSNSIINNTLKPAFQQGDFFGGIDRATDNIISATRGEYTVPETTLTNQDIDFYLNIVFYLFFFLIWIASILARSTSWWAGGVLGGVLGAVVGYFLGFFYVGIVSMLFFIPFGLLLDFIVSKAYQSGTTTGHYPWWIGGPRGGGGFSGGGGSFGGFGGGRSGGGGSSGSW